MKKLIFVALFLLLTSNGEARHVSKNSFTFAAAGAGTVLADTGPLSEGSYQFTAYCTCVTTAAVNCSTYLQRRNAANTSTSIDSGTDEQSQGMFLVSPAAAGVGSATIPFVYYSLADSERIRIVLATNITGTVWCSIWYAD